MPRTPCSEIVIVPSHDANRPTMLAPRKKKIRKKRLLHLNRIVRYFSHINLPRKIGEARHECAEPCPRN